MEPERLIAQTRRWIADVVVGCNFCPFAAREVRRDSLGFVVEAGNKAAVLQRLSAVLAQLAGDASVETLFLLTPGFRRFSDYLKLLQAANALLRREGYEGTFQLASFHPDYLFAGTPPSDPANYTNRAPWPMLQVLRESSVSRAVDVYPDPEQIPVRNSAFARAKGLPYMQALLAACKEG